MIVNREELLNVLEAVLPGVDKKATIEQSDCFIFQDGKVITFNDEIAASCAAPMKGLSGAIKAEPLIQLLRKLTEDQVKMEVRDNELVVATKTKKRSGILLEADIVLPVDTIDPPSDWKKLPDDFGDAVQIVKNCAGKDESQFILTCVHFTDSFIEACDNMQVTRYPMKLPIESACLIRRDSIKHVAQLGMSEISETQNWVHLKNPAGLILSCRRYAEDFPELGSILDASGTKTILPGGLAEACDKASIFSADSPDDNEVEVSLKGGNLQLSGRGASGWYEERSTVTYSGPELVFRIDPKLLTELTKRTSECEVCEDKLMIDGGSFRYVACLG